MTLQAAQQMEDISCWATGIIIGICVVIIVLYETQSRQKKS